MDPLHITEFASPKYFDKLRSLNNVGGEAHTQSEEAQPAQASTFILPIGNPRPASQRRRRSDDTVRSGEQKKRSLGYDLTSWRAHGKAGFTSSIVAFRSKTTSKQEEPYVDFSTHKVVETRLAKPVLTLHDHFFLLPTEIQVQIVAPLPVPTILRLRLVSRSFHNLVALNEAPISRHHLRNSVPEYALRLYPISDPIECNLRYLCGIWHRLHVSAKLSVLIAEHTTREIFLRDNDAKRLEFEPQHTRMRRRLMPLIFTIFHFFETHRRRHAEHLLSHGVPLRLQPFTLNPIEQQIMEAYDDTTLLKVHQIFPLVLASFSRRLRPPSYVGRLERSFKGYLKDKPADEIYAAILLIGGLRQAEKVWEVKGYNSRRALVDTWYGAVSHEPVTPTGKSSRLALLTSIGRKKSAQPAGTVIADNAGVEHKPSCGEWFCVKQSCSQTRTHDDVSGQLVSSSLSAGPPMGPLPREQLKLLLADQQPLTSIWLQTAEAVILDRQIVESSRDIKRNTQVLLELIREDGDEVDEEWAPAFSHESRQHMTNLWAADIFSARLDM